MGNSPSQTIQKDIDTNTIYEVVEVDENDKLKNDYNTLKENYDMLNNELYSKKLEIENMKKEKEELEKEKIKLNEDIKHMDYLNEVLEIKTKNQNIEYNKLKDKYDNLEYNKLDIEEKYLNQLDKIDCINFLKKTNEKLELDLNKEIVKCNDEKNMNIILGESLNDMTKQYSKYKELYSQISLNLNTTKSSEIQYKKEYKNILKKNEEMINTISKNLNSKLFKKQLYNSLETVFEEEPFVYNELIESIIKIVLNNIIIEKMKKI